jgi:NitT/TauT family transport system permease protein
MSATTATSRTTSGRPERNYLAMIGLPLIGLVVLLAVWWLATIVFDINSIILPSPPEVVSSFLRLPGFMLQQALTTLQEAVEGFVISVLLGLPLAALLTSSRLVQRAVMPILVATNAIPKVAVAPLLIVWLGFDTLPKVIMVIVICFFPIVVSAMSGLSTTPADLGELARSMSASRWQTYIKIRVPWALPQIFTGLKVAITLAVIGAVVGELSGGNLGLGSVITTSGAAADTATAFAAILLLAVIGIGLFYLVILAEYLLLPWVRETSA